MNCSDERSSIQPYQDRERRRRFSIALGLCLVQFLSLIPASPSAAGTDLTLFGPKRYDRLKGSPTQSSCLHCHGLKGDGNGPEALQYGPRPTDFTSSRMNQPTDHVIEKAIVVGLPAVPAHAWGARLSNDEVAAVIRYARSLQR